MTTKSVPGTKPPNAVRMLQRRMESIGYQVAVSRGDS